MTPAYLGKELFRMTGAVFRGKDFARLGAIIKKYPEESIYDALEIMRASDVKFFQDFPINYLQGVLSRQNNKEEVSELLSTL